MKKSRSPLDLKRLREKIEKIIEGNGAEAFSSGGWRSHKILIVLFLIYLSDYSDRMVVSSMIEFIKRDWGISDAQAGWLIGAVILFITFFSIPASILIDRWSRRKMVAIMTFFWSLATLACAFTKNYTQLLIARSFIGVGEAGYAPGGTAILAGAYPEEKRARMMGIWNASIPLGAGIGLMTGGLIATKWGWHSAFGIVSVPGMFLAVAAWFMPDYKSVKVENSATGFGEVGGFFKKALSLIRIPSLTLTYLGFAMNVSATTALMTWLPTYLERTGVAESGKGGVIASGIFALVLFGAPLGGFISDAWYKTQKKARLYSPAISSFLSSVLLLAVALTIREKVIALTLLAFYGIMVTCFIAPAVSVTQDVVHPGFRALSYGLCIIFQHVLGDIWSPPMIGKISDMIGMEKAIFFVTVYGVFAAVFFFIASRYYVRDLERVESVVLEVE